MAGTTCHNCESVGEPVMTHVLPSLIAGLIFLTVLLPNPVVGATPVPVSNVLGSTTAHTVAPRETLYSIARRYGTTVDALMAANGLTSHVIKIGQTLHVGSSSSQPPTDTYHTVVRGNTLYSLARRYGTTVDAIMQANRLTGPNIYVGQRLLIVPTSAPPVGSTVYTVMRGDTLYSIARRYGTTVETIKALNNISGNIIYIGQLLRIPQSVKFPTATPIVTQTPTPVTTLTPTTTPIPPQTPVTVTTTPAPTATPTTTTTPSGNVVEQDGYSLTALAVENPSTRPHIIYQPQAGQKLVGVEVIVRNISGEPFTSLTLFATLVDTSGFLYGAEAVGVEGLLEPLTVNLGEMVRGWIGFTIPQDATPARIRYRFSPSDTIIEVNVP